MPLPRRRSISPATPATPTRRPTTTAGVRPERQRARQAIASAKDSDYNVNWSLKRGEQVFFTAPRGVIVRQTINHLVHHRGQLTVYLRLIDVPVPSIYGPTADEPMPGLSPGKK